MKSYCNLVKWGTCVTNEDIRAFITVARCGTFSGAAEQLHISQPALSKRISALESELECNLIIRKKGSRTVTLTSEGKAFIPIANQWWRFWERGKEVIRNADRKRFGIVLQPAMSRFLFAEVLQQLQQRHPEMDLEVFLSDYQSARTLVANGAADVGFSCVGFQNKHTEGMITFLEKICFVTRADSPYGKCVSVEELKAEKCIVGTRCSVINKWFERTFPEKKPLVTTEIPEEVALFLERGTPSMFAFVPIYMARFLEEKGFVIHELEQPMLMNSVYRFNRSGYRSLYLAELLSLLQEKIEQVEGCAWVPQDV